MVCALCGIGVVLVFVLSGLVVCSGDVQWCSVIMYCVYWCSAGVGRTGTLIGIDMAITQAPTDGLVDIPSIVTKLRRQRMKMVQTAVSVMKLY